MPLEISCKAARLINQAGSNKLDVARTLSDIASRKDDDFSAFLLANHLLRSLLVHPSSLLYRIDVITTTSPPCLVTTPI